MTYSIVLALWLTALPVKAQTVTVGSKSFTESVILGDITKQLIASEGYEVEHKEQLGGSAILWNGLLTGELDAYPDYTGTLIQETLASENIQSIEALEEALNARGIRMTAPLGFNNTYAIGMREERADELGMRSISDMTSHPDLVGGFSNEFMERGDGWPGLQETYQLPQTNVRGLQHDLAYRGLEAGNIDFTDLYSTDAEIAYYNIRVLHDDRGYFPEYQALLLYRADLEERVPAVDSLLALLAGSLNEASMTTLNARVKLSGFSEAQAAADFLNANILQDNQVTVETETMWGRLWRHTLEHLALVLISLVAAILLAIPLGIIAAKHARWGQVILGITGMIYTIPSLALLVFMIPLLGIGGPPALMALFLYSLLPIVRNTHTGLVGISPSLIESAEALGLSPMAKLRRIELPLASPSILAGIQTSAIINIGTATLGALIGAGGYGQPILTGIRLDSIPLILEGAVPAALMALAAQGVFELAERFVVPRGLRN